MKAISVQQPWAWAILHAGKDLENRQVRFKYRGPLLIHAPLRLRATDRMPRGVRQPTQAQIRRLLGFASLTETDGFLKQHGVYLECDAEALAQDTANSRLAVR